ncbi:MAG: transglycosylase SLT domain-containing protein [Streptomyces sp.]|nr:transglycosylase SLT domain-containing protein [Streptomyces sp.]
MPNVGYATLQIIPSVRGISDELRRQLVGPAGDAGDSAGEAAGGGFKEAFSGALAAIGVAEAASKLGERFIEAFNQSMEQANVTSTLQAQLGASNSDASKYGASIGRLYAKGVTDSFEQGAEVIRSVVNAGLVDPKATNAQLDSIATKMVDVANTFGTDLSLQTQAVSALMKNGLAKNAGAALDLITTGLQKLGPNAEDLLETFQEYPVQLKKLGLDAQTAMGLFQQGLKGGARDTDIVADALKEFSIRSIDMSNGSRDAYKALGLNAKSMEQQIAKGGSSATAGLQTVLDKLRGIHDPVKREAAAVGLFGTQAEELGTSLFKLDPSKASKTFSDVGGAADRLGKTLRSGPSYEIEVFKRQLQQGLVNFIGGEVLPLVTTLATGFNTYLLPPIRTVGTALGATLIPALTGLWQAGAAVVTWLKDMGTWLIPIGIAVAGFTAALLAQQIATAGVTLVFSLYRGAILAWTAVQRGATIAQLAFNAVMNANPVILVITAIVALGAALVVAYQKSETFRQIVQAAWAGIQTAALFVWNSVLKPAFAGIMTALSALGSAFSWLWNSVIKPTFSFIATAAKILAVVLALTVFLPITLSVIALAKIFPWLWTNAIKPAFGWIVQGALALWTGVKTVFGWFTGGLRALGRWATWLWTNAISPVVGWVVTGFRTMWTGVKVVFGWFTGGIKTLATWAKWLWTNAIKPVWDGIKNTISTVYTAGIKPVFDKLRGALGQVGKAFSAAKDAIKIAWDKVKAIAKAPVSFIVNTVYNHGIVAVWNKVAGAFGAPKLSPYKFASGGVLPGYTPGRDVHLAALSGGEAIMRPEWTRAVGPGYVHSMNAAARHGGVRGVQQALGLPGFSGGGIFDWIGKGASKLAGYGSDAWNAVKKGASWLKDTLAASARAGVEHVVKPLLKRIPGLDNSFGRAIANVPNKVIDALFGYADKADKKGASETAFGGGTIPAGRHKAIITAALKAAGVPPPGAIGQWLSGMNTLISRESGWNASAINRTDSNAKAGHPSQGLAQTIPGTFNAYVPSALKSRGILDPVANVAAAIRYIVSRYGNITRVQQANASKPPKGYANGGRPRVGEVFWVGERGPELMQLGSGGATVWDSATSMRMAAGLGKLRGFAKGTSKASRPTARKQIPGDITSVSKALTASASDIKKAFDELTKDLRAAGGAGKALAASTSKASAKLQALAKQRDSVDDRLAEAKSAAKDQKKAASDYFGLSQVGDAATFSDLLGGLKSKQAEAKTFQQQIAALSKKGVSQDIISQLVAAGPGSNLIGLVSGASKDQLKQLNALSKSGAKLSTSYGNTMADAMYDAGSQAGKGFLTGLKSQAGELQAEMDKLGEALVKAVKKKLKIHSPSKVTHALGAYTGQGFAVGLDSTSSQVAAAAARVSQAATPAAPRAAGRAGAAGAVLPEKVRLVVRDHEFDAYLDTRADGRVDAGFARLRQTVRNSK